MCLAVPAPIAPVRPTPEKTVKPHLIRRLSRLSVPPLLAAGLLGTCASLPARGSDDSAATVGHSPGSMRSTLWSSEAVWTSAAPEDLDDPKKKELAMRLLSSAENSSLDWKAQYGYIEDINDGCGYTAGIVGFCSATGDMLQLVEDYTARKPSNPLAKYLPALRAVKGSPSHKGLDPGFPKAWKKAAKDKTFQKAQRRWRDRLYFKPAVSQAKKDGLRSLGQFAYFDAAVMHGKSGLMSIRSAAKKRAKTPAQGGNETKYLRAFLDARVKSMRKRNPKTDTSRVDTAQRVFLEDGNLDLDTPLTWHVYGDKFHIKRL